MPGHRLATDTARVGIIKGIMLDTAMAEEALSSAGNTVPMQTNAGNVYKFKRFILPSATGVGAGTDNLWVGAGQDDEFVAARRGSEGVTPVAKQVTSTIISATPIRYSLLYSYSKETAILFEDDIPKQEVEFAGQEIKLVRELHNFGKLKAATNAFFGGTGTTTATVNGPVTTNLLMKVKQDLRRYHCKPQTQALRGSSNYATYPIPACWPLYTHTDMEYDLRRLPGFVDVSEYGTQDKISPLEIGADRQSGFRFILSPELTYQPNAGAAVGATGLASDNATNINVYSMIVMGSNYFTQVALRGKDSIRVDHIPHDRIDKSDPGGDRGYVFGETWHVAEITNQDWGATIEVGRTAL